MLLVNTRWTPTQDYNHSRTTSDQQVARFLDNKSPHPTFVGKSAKELLEAHEKLTEQCYEMIKKERITCHPNHVTQEVHAYISRRMCIEKPPYTQEDADF